MAKKTVFETGHTKNVDNLGLLNITIASYGEAYKPANPAILLEALKTKEKEGRAAVVALNDVLPTYSRAVAERDNAFKPLNPLVTRSLNFLRASGVSAEVANSAASIIKKIRGDHPTPPKKEVKTMEGGDKAAEAKPKANSTSQHSYDSVIDNLERLVQLLAATPEYVPNEVEIKIDALKALATSLRAKNTACESAKVALDNARNARNQVLYTPKKGLVDLAADAKTYVKALFGATSAEYKKVAKIEFTKE